jgi:hypothetical protein
MKVAYGQNTQTTITFSENTILLLQLSLKLGCAIGLFEQII